MSGFKNSAGETLAETLRKRRKLLKITLEELSDKTAVPVKHLRRIERGEWSLLPSPVYVRGFLKNYARVAGINPEDVISRYDKEILEKELPPATEDIKKPRFTAMPAVSPRALKLSAVLIVLIFILGYIGYQFSAVLAYPELSVEQPDSLETVTDTDSVVFRGKADKGADILLNNQSVALTPDGRFERTIELLPGINVFEIKAVSRFGKETTIIRRVIYNP